MAEEDNKKHNGDTSRNGWWSRCQKSMGNVWSFAKEYSVKSAGVIGKLYYLSLTAGWTLLGAGMYGVPGAPEASIGAFAGARALKFAWDQARDIKDATEDLTEPDEGTDTKARLSETDRKIQELEQVIEEQRSVIKAQMESGEQLQCSQQELSKALLDSHQKIAELQSSHGQVTRALQMMLEASKGDDPRAGYRMKYTRELGEAVERGELTKVPFNQNEDDLVRFEESETTESPSHH